MNAKVLSAAFSVLLLACLPTSKAFASEIFRCDASDTFHKGVITWDVTRNRIDLRTDDGRVAIYKKGTYCGRKPQISLNVQCPFTGAENDSDTYRRRDLLCLAYFENGAVSALTTGAIRINPEKGEGDLRCSVHGKRTYDLDLSNCRKL